MNSSTPTGGKREAQYLSVWVVGARKLSVLSLVSELQVDENAILIRF